ncbi:histidine kinase [Microbacterium sp. ARD32]|uniref:sensor histidine kinase n=1 Tax=Microbacterium sp. ARD32 TaxID=2962577 RepID=UPI002880C066|nr:histidine kinase [Microbacterium sp. ARD32]MDT0158291.1 histidine kinase [Microbacterium sp. ARD32]
MLVFLAAVTGMDVIGLITTPGADLIETSISIASTVVFVFYLWWPPIATILLCGVFAASAFVGQDTAVLFAAAVAVGMVMRLGSTTLVLAYLGGFFVATAVVAYGDHTIPVNVGIYLVVAAVAGAVGYALRLASTRGRTLELRLAESAEQERQAVLAERRWIAGELHDSIAHHLTVVALHVQMLDDPGVSAQSQEAIRVAARKAMADLRFVIELADDGPRVSSVPTGDLLEAIDEARSEIAAAGHAVSLEGDPLDERIPRIADIVFARIVRESVTNILKHAGPGEVAVRLRIDDDHAILTIRSPLPETPRRDLPSSGTGLNRMAERVIGASGEFSAGPVDGAWEVSARLPMA